MGWLIAVLVVIIISSLFFINVKLKIIYDDELYVFVKVLFFKFTLIPQKKETVNPKDYSIKALKKKQKKNKTVEKTEQRKDESKKTPVKQRIKDILSTVSLIKNIIDRIIKDLGKYLVIDVSVLQIWVSTDDAAKTAILYGTVSQIVSYICEALSNVTNFNPKSKKSICVNADYVSGECYAKINIGFGLKIWQVIILVAEAMAEYSKQKSNPHKKEK